MRPQRIVRVSDARRTQDRVILSLECRHNVSVWSADLWHHPVLAPGVSIECIHCPDPTPVEVQQAKSTIQLWKEAGEP